MSKWALFDSSWLGYRARFSIKGMSFNDLPTGVIFGYLEQLRSTCADPHLLTNQVALCFDSRQSVRKDSFPTYKSNRTKDQKTPEEWAETMVMKSQVKRLRREILPDCGFKCYRQVGIESDDIMAMAAQQLVEYPTCAKSVIITADGDLFQCVTSDTHWFDPSRNLYLDEIGVWRKKGIPPGQWAEVKAIAGCKGDCVPGIDGVGEATAVQYLLGLTNKAHKRHQAIASLEGQAIIERNRHLVTLPHLRTTRLDLTPPQYNPKAFYNWAEKLGFSSYLTGGRRRAWDQFFAGDFDRIQTARKRGEVRV